MNRVGQYSRVVYIIMFVLILIFLLVMIKYIGDAGMDSIGEMLQG